MGVGLVERSSGDVRDHFDVGAPAATEVNSKVHTHQQDAYGHTDQQ